MQKILLTVLLAFGLGACNSETAAPNAGAGEAAAVEPHDHSHTHNVQCGCAIDGVGECGNYVEVDGKYIPLAGDLGLTEMEFCKKNGLMADIEGEVKDGKFVATSFHYHQH